jgi:hypothetical protein
MPRGSRPGERRGGRQGGTPNKKTLLKNAVFCAGAADPNRSSLDFMLALMRDPQVTLDERIDLAAKAAPFVHARPQPTSKKRPDPLDLRDHLGESGDLKFGKVDSKPAANGGAGEGGGAGAGKSGAGGEGEGLSPLDFLLGVMNDPAATPEQRVKAAAVAARYKHPCAGQSDVPTISVVEDKFGFKVDPELARAELDDSLREIRIRTSSHLRKKDSVEAKVAEQELEQIGERRGERLARLSFPDGYAYADRQTDENRLAQLSSKRSSRKKLTPEEDAEEAHLAVRVLHPEAKPEPRVFLARLTHMKWPTTRIAELDERVVGGEALTGPEETERQDLRRRYSESAAEADKLDHLYRYRLRKETDIAKKSGMELSKALDAARAKCDGLRDPTKIAWAEIAGELVQKMHRLESLRFDELLTPEEAGELEELHRLYPQRAEKARKFVLRRLIDGQLNNEAMVRTGYKPRPIEQGEWPRIWTSRADNARSRTPGPSSGNP